MAFENSFKGKTVLVTGAGRGIGKAVALKLDSLGANVWAVSKNPNNLTALKSEAPKIQTVSVDLGDWTATRAAIEKIPVVFDCLLNNAAVCPTGKFMDITPDQVDLVCNVNLKSVMIVSQVVAKKMIEAGKSGSIVNVSSIGGLKATPMVSTYSIFKAGLDQLTRIMAIELGPHKIRVNSVNPGGVPTDMLTSVLSNVASLADEWGDAAQILKRIPLGRPMLEIDEVVNSILFYLSDLVPILTGTCLPVDGGYLLT